MIPPAEPVWAVEFADFSKSYRPGWSGGRVHAVQSFSLRLAPGQVLGLFGPNGSGKSTTLKALAGLITPTGGACRIFGHPAECEAVRARVAYLPEAPQFTSHLTGREFLEYGAGLHSLDHETAARRIREVLHWSDLGAAADWRIGTYSKGMRQRLGLARTVLPNPSLVLLDEPASGLDPEGRLGLHLLIRELARQGTTVVFSSHLLGQAEAGCDRIAILGRGRLLADGTPAELLGPGRSAHSEPAGLEKLYLEKLHPGAFAVAAFPRGGPPAEAVASMSAIRPNGPAAALRRICLMARHAFGAAMHLQLTLLLALTGAGLVLGAHWLQAFNFGGAELKFIADFGLGVIGLGGSLLAVLATAHLFLTELENRAVSFVLTGPVRRWEYLAGKFAGAVMLLTGFVATLTLLLAGILAWRESQLGTACIPLTVFLQAGAVQWLNVTLVAAMTLLVCSYASSVLFASGAGLLLALVAHLRGFASGGWSSVLVVPDLGLFDTGVLLATGQPAALKWLLSLTGYWAAYVLLFVALASHVFQRREL